MAGACVCVAAIGMGTVLWVVDDGVTEVVAAGDATAESVDELVADDVAVTSTPVESVTAEEPSTAVEQQQAAASDDVDVAVSVVDTASGARFVETDTRPSAVSFAGGSGVLLAPDGSGGYVGLAQRFGPSGVEAIGLSSPNGLDWSEEILDGIPEGATATLLDSYGGTHVAVFSQPSGSSNDVVIGVSEDMVNWSVGDPLPGSQVFALHLAVGPNGVVVLGDDFDRAVWSGSLNGEVESRSPLADVGTVHGITVVDGEFVIVGRSDGELVMLRSVDGVDWSSEPLAAPEAASAASLVRVTGGAIVLASVTDEEGGTTAFVSRDAGASWAAIEVDPVVGIGTASDNTALLSADDGVMTVTLFGSEDLAEVTLDLVSDARVEVLAVDDARVVMLQADDEGLTWVTVER